MKPEDQPFGEWNDAADVPDTMIGLVRELARAGALEFFAGFTHCATAVPDATDPPRPILNRPYPPA